MKYWNRFVTRQEISIATKGLDWLWENRDGFKIRESRDADMPWNVKPVVELMFMVSVLRRHGFDYPMLGKLSDYAAEAADDFDWHQMAAYDPSVSTALALALNFYRLTGKTLPFEETHFRYLADIRFFEGMDRLPYRQMDMAHSLAAVGIHDYEAYLAAWFANTAFGRWQHLARYSVGDLYSLTHAVFYLTDVGVRPDAPCLDSGTNARMRRALINLAAIIARGDNLDVLGELLLCHLMCGGNLGGREGRIFDAVLRHLQAGYCDDGSLPPTRAILEKAKKGKAVFAELYHTTLVSTLLFSFLSKAKQS
ncbi:MAG: hypothetical protein J2P52_04270 [Blastocatellia bacterium]|nr:hypothetical protein [Blastocatellia bacterium]